MGEAMEDHSRLLDTIPTSFFLTDVHSRILYANHQAEMFFGYTSSEMKGQRMRIFFLDEDLLYFLPNIIYLTRFREGFDGEALLRQKNGNRIFVRLSTAAFKEGGEVFLTFCIQEIQRLKSLERERSEVERWASLGRMVEEIAHQFRNPIASIGGFAKRLSGPLPSQTKRKVYLQQIVQETSRLETILKRVEEYVRIPRPRFQLENIREVTEKTLSRLAKKAATQSIYFHLETQDLRGDGKLYIDADLVQRALGHVLENSLEAFDSPKPQAKKKTIAVSLSDNGQEVRVSIADRGKGISKKILPFVFDPFFSTRPDRVGLGLTFARRVMEEHGGKIGMESRPRKGTQVTFFFPKDRRRRIRREWLAPEAAEKDESYVSNGVA
jgi:PAS domain S-box-containing protein